MVDSVVVVGAGLAGIRAAEGLRARGFPGSVVILGAEPYPPYDRPPLSKAALIGTTGPAWLYDQDLLAAMKIDLRLGVTARSLNTNENIIVSLIRVGSHPSLLALFSRNEHLVGGLAISLPGHLHRLRRDIELRTSLSDVMARITT